MLDAFAPVIGISNEVVQCKRLFHSETERIIIVTVLSVLRNIHIRSANLSFTGGEVAEAFVPWHSSAGVLHSMSVVVVMVVMVVGGGAGGRGGVSGRFDSASTLQFDSESGE